MTAHPLGRHVEHDEFSWAFPFTAHLAPGPVLWPHHGATLDQGSLGSCTGNAVVQCLSTGPLYRSTWRASERKAVQCYSLATQLDDVPGQYPPTDTGSSGLSACKAAQQLGWVSGYQHVFGVDHARQAITASPFIVGTDWYESMFTPDATGFVRPAGRVAGGHEYVCLGWDPTSDMWTFLNSWGKWGIGIKGIATTGLFHMSGENFAALLSQQGDITVPVH